MLFESTAEPAVHSGNMFSAGSGGESVDTRRAGGGVLKVQTIVSVFCELVWSVSRECSSQFPALFPLVSPRETKVAAFCAAQYFVPLFVLPAFCLPRAFLSQCEPRLADTTGPPSSWSSGNWNFQLFRLNPL